MKLITWNLNGRHNRTQQQVEALAAHCSDIVALQEVTAHSLSELQTALAVRGWSASWMDLPPSPRPTGRACIGSLSPAGFRYNFPRN